MKLTGIKKRSKKIGYIVNRVIVAVFVLFILSIFLWIHRQDVLRAQAEYVGEDKSPIQAVKEFNYGKSGFQEVAKNEKYTLYTDFTTGEIYVKENATGYKWYSNPQDRENDSMIAIKSNLSAQFYLTSLDLDNKTTKEENNFAGSVETGNMTSELVENGVKYIFAFPATGIVVPVQYTLNEHGLLAEVLVDEIQEQWSRYAVANISLLPWFGAGGLEEEGYLFVPDGSGTIMEFNNGKNRFRQYAAPVYGPNMTTTNPSATVNEQVLLPVFGINKQEHGFLGVITEGEAYATINACVSRKGSSYNYTYSSAVLRDYDTASVGKFQGSYGDESNGIDTTEGLVLDRRYSVQYFFLEEGAAEYPDMAVCYREYLLENGGLKQSELADKQYMILDLYGAVSIEQYVIGVNTPVVTALTTYEDVINIVKELKSEGVENLIVNYIGALDSGLHNELFTKVKSESALGSRKEFNEMVEYLEQEGVILFLETNPIELYNDGNGYSVSGDSVKGFFQSNVFEYKLELDSGERDTSLRWRLIQPKLVPDFMEIFVRSAVKKNTNNVAIAQIGEILYSDYADEADQFTSRQQAQKYWEKSLAVTSALADHVLVHKGNAYCAPYADVIVDAPSGDSQYDMADYSVPFYQMVLRGESVLGTEAINASENYEESFLKAQELGSSLKYSLIAGDVKDLIGTEYNNMMSYSYDFWKETLVEQYRAMQDTAELTDGQVIADHSYVAENVTLTRFANGTSVLVNYSEKNYTYNGQTVAAGSYLVQGGTE